MNIDDLIIPEWNAKQDSPVMMRKLRTSIGEYGYLVPVVVNKLNNHVVSGVRRIEALKDMGEKEIDVVFTTLKLPENEMACSLALNKIDFEWDDEKLKSVLEAIDASPIDFLKLSGFTEAEINELKG